MRRTAALALAKMQRPRNRQPRPNRQQDNRPARGHPSPATDAQRNGTVPTIREVVRGAGVSIVLKEDQPTGEETQGVVQTVLTKGNHPRGIKVKLMDGQVGRVQRMLPKVGDDASVAGSTNGYSAATTRPASNRFTMRYTDVRNDDYLEGPPPRGLADFMPPEPTLAPAATMDANVPTAKCPICDDFEGDEVAVSHHVEKDHLAG